MSYSFKSPKYSNKTLRKEITADSRLANIKAAHNSDVEKINKSVVIHSLNSRGKSLTRGARRNITIERKSEDPSGSPNKSIRK